MCVPERGWTAAEFRAVGLALHGDAHGWQAALARKLGVTARTVRRWASGETPFPTSVQRELIALTGGGQPSVPPPCRDEWIIGDGPPHAAGGRREYVLHAWHPRFFCRVLACDADTEVPAATEGEADVLTGIVFQADAETLLCEFQWIDRPPSDDRALLTLMEQAADRLDTDAD